MKKNPTFLNLCLISSQILFSLFTPCVQQTSFWKEIYVFSLELLKTTFPSTQWWLMLHLPLMWQTQAVNKSLSWFLPVLKPWKALARGTEPREDALWVVILPEGTLKLSLVSLTFDLLLCSFRFLTAKPKTWREKSALLILPAMKFQNVTTKNLRWVK